MTEEQAAKQIFLAIGALVVAKVGVYFVIRSAAKRWHRQLEN